MQVSSNVIEDTLVAFALRAEATADELDRRLDRVGLHYGALLDDAPLAGRLTCGRLGLAVWSRRLESSRWPVWVQDEDVAIAISDTPTGWSRLIGDRRPGSDAALDLGRTLTSAPVRAAEMTPPFALAVLDRGRHTLTVANDPVGAGRLYELEFDGGVVWSNRLGALSIFTGEGPDLDLASWQVFAACGWFLGSQTPVKGATKVPPGTVIQARDSAAGASVSHVDTGALRRLVEPRRVNFDQGAQTAAEHVVQLLGDLDSMSTEPLRISLTGGRDSRLSAAGALAAGIEAGYNTGDQVSGEVDVVRELIAAAPRPMVHRVLSPPGDVGGGDPLDERVRSIHLVHDGMRNPQELRRPTEIPFTGRIGFSLSGHGGELGHGFYYSDAKKLKRLEKGGRQGLLDQLERSARRKHSAATEDAYAEYMDECDRTISQAESYGLEGPMLLDFFYLAQRLPYRSGLGARTGRASVCVTPGFVRAAFDLSPGERLEAKLHRAVISQLVPEWKRIGFFKGESGPMPEIKRARIWEREDEARVVAEMLAAPELWSDIFVVEKIRSMWSEVRAGGGSADYEHIFDRVVWKVGFEGHAEALRAAVEDS